MFCRLFYAGMLCFMLLLFPYYLLADSGDKVAESGDNVEQINGELASNTLEDEAFLLVHYGKEATVITPTRYLKPVSQVAENITVITSDIIRQMNAHTVAEVLNSVTGVQMETRFAFSNGSTLNMQGAGFRFVRVLIDGVTLNDLANNFARAGNIPVQMIDRIEIIKGPASSTWGSSLGGVINIITKSGLPVYKVSGMLSASYGERNSGDDRAEARGKVSNLDYYVYGGHLGTNGFSPHSSYDGNSFYTKERLEITDTVNVQYTLGYNNLSQGVGFYPITIKESQDNKFHNYFSTLTLTDSIANNATLSLSGRYSNQYSDDKYSDLGGAPINAATDKLTSTGATVNLTWEPEDQTIIIGSEYDDGQDNTFSIYGKKSLIKSAFFVNDTIKNLVNNVYITPGLRFDHISANGSFLSPSLGATYNPLEGATLRFVAARGFNVPGLYYTYGTGTRYLPSPDLKVERVWSYQTGIETTILKYAWLKMTVFRHEVDNGITAVPVDASHYKAINRQKQRRQGLEVELETFPFYNVSLSSGYALADTRDMLTQIRLQSIIRHTIDIGLRYKKETFTAYLYSHYLVWDNVPSSIPYSDRSFVFNLNVVKRFYENKRTSADAFLTGHNLFNASQHFTEVNNPRRWIEGGVRFNF